MASLAEILNKKKSAEKPESKNGLLIKKKDQNHKSKNDPEPPGPRQLDSTKADSENVPMEFPDDQPSRNHKMWLEVLGGLDTDRCVYVEPAAVWLCVKVRKSKWSNHSKRVVAFHDIPRTDPLAEYLIKTLPVLNPNGEKLNHEMVVD